MKQRLAESINIDGFLVQIFVSCALGAIVLDAIPPLVYSQVVFVVHFKTAVVKAFQNEPTNEPDFPVWCQYSGEDGQQQRDLFRASSKIMNMRAK